MARLTFNIVIDQSSVRELAETLLDAVENASLPQHLQRELEALLAGEGNFFDVEFDERMVAHAIPTPRMMALIGNLRANLWPH